TESDIQPFAKGLEGIGADGPAVLRRVLHWTQGHPYLTQRLCRALVDHSSSGTADVDELCKSLFFSSQAREQDNNLVFVRELLLYGDDRASLLSLYRQVRTERVRVSDDITNPLVSHLRLSGVVRSQEGRLIVRNRIYA